MLIAKLCSLGSGYKWTMRVKADGIERAALKIRELVWSTSKEGDEQKTRRDLPDPRERSKDQETLLVWRERRNERQNPDDAKADDEDDLFQRQEGFDEEQKGRRTRQKTSEDGDFFSLSPTRCSPSQSKCRRFVQPVKKRDSKLERTGRSGRRRANEARGR